MDWAIYGALILGFAAVAAAAGLLLVRALEAWRAYKRFRRHLGRELDGLAQRTAAMADNAAAAGDQTRLQLSLADLRIGLAQFAVIRSAVDEATDALGRFTAVYPRK